MQKPGQQWRMQAVRNRGGRLGNPWLLPLFVLDEAARRLRWEDRPRL